MTGRLDLRGPVHARGLMLANGDSPVVAAHAISGFCSHFVDERIDSLWLRKPLVARNGFCSHLVRGENRCGVGESPPRRAFALHAAGELSRC